MPELTAKTFCERFVASYTEVLSSFLSKERWNEVWPKWNDLVLARHEEFSRRLPPEIKTSVLADVARHFELCYASRYASRQPMTFDAVFSEQQDWFPITVAIEHENDCRDSWSEIYKLFSVRCPLKVGITYTLSNMEECEQSVHKVADTIREGFDRISKLISEDPKAEYLFIVGAELRDELREISCWYSMQFLASDGPGNQTFQPVQIAALQTGGV